MHVSIGVKKVYQNLDGPEDFKVIDENGIEWVSTGALYKGPLSAWGARELRCGVAIGSIGSIAELGPIYIRTIEDATAYFQAAELAMIDVFFLELGLINDTEPTG